MSTLILAVGGSGQHVALAASRLKYLRALPDSVTCRVIDGDDKSDLATCLKTFDNLRDAVNRPVFASDPHPLGVNQFQTPYSGSRTRFRELCLAGSNPGDIDEAVYEALFSPREVDLNVAKGFYGRPAVGATAFAGAAGDTLENIVAEGVERYLIVGSFVGGTGAGVIPSMIHYLAGEGGVRDKLYGAFLLNWLSISGTAEVDNAVMDHNMRHGTQFFFERLKPMLRASVLIGPSPSGEAWSQAAKVDGAKETRAIFPIVAAYAAHFFSASAASSYNQTVMLYHQPKHQRDWLLSRGWHGDGTTQITLLARLQALDLVIFMLGQYHEHLHEHLRTYIEGGFMGLGFMGLGKQAGRVPPGLRETPAWSKHAGEKELQRFLDVLWEDLSHRRTHARSVHDYFAEVLGVPEEKAFRLRYDDAAKVTQGLIDMWSGPIPLPVQITEAGVQGNTASVAHALGARLFENARDWATGEIAKMGGK